jgi:hypothetical protein
MKKIKKQPPVTSERSVTPVLRARYVLLYERHSSYHRMAEKKLKQSPVRPVTSVTSASQIRYVPLHERHSSYRRMAEKKLKQSPVRPVTSVTPVSQVSYASGMNGIAHTSDMNRMVHIAGRLKK